MVAAVVKSLNDRLSDLHAERLRTWPHEQLQANILQRRNLVEEAAHRRFISVGDTVPDFRLPEVDGGEVVLSELLKSGPVVLIFFRFAGCPACNIALPYYQEALFPGLEELGASLLALSPQTPERLVEIKRRHGLGFHVVSDLDNGLGRSFGVTFEPSPEAKAKTIAEGRAPITETTGASTWELPMPTVVVIEPSGRVVFAEVSPDWLVRTEADAVLSAVRAASRTPVAA